MNTAATVNAIKQMLGTNEPNLNANKANKIMRRKIQFMIDDENVAEDFLDLVD